MSVEEVTELCRLCLKNENLVWIFDERFENKENIKEVIFITTGVEIQNKDVISQKICKKCLQIVIKMYQFRGTSMKNDKLLKEKHMDLIKGGGVKIANTSITIKCDKTYQKVGTKPEVKPNTGFDIIHPSVSGVYKKYPNIKLPNNCLHMDVAPCVSMHMNDVENYFIEHNSSMQEHIFLSLQALRSGNNKNVVSPICNEARETTESRPSSKTSDHEDDSSKKNIAISPINIKLANTGKTEYKIVKKDDELKKERLKVAKRKISSRESTPDRYSPILTKKKRRKLSDSSCSSRSSSISSYTESSTKPNIIESLGLKPSSSTSTAETEAPVQLSYVERTLQICNICNSVQYSIKELKRHQLKHLRCQFCKAKFKTMEGKLEHIEKECVTKKTMISLPDVILTKVELDLALRQKYPNAFTSFPSISGLDVKSVLVENKSDKTDCENTRPSVIPASTGNVGDIIEIISDDEEPNAVKAQSNFKDSTNVLTDPSTKSTPNSTDVPTVQNNVITPSTDALEIQPTTLPPNLSSSVVKPDIRIKSNYILDTIDPKATDLFVMKELLKNYRKLQLMKDVYVQPDLPSNTTIKTNLRDYTATLRDLKKQLHVYRIPVEVKYGTYNVTFDYTPKQTKAKKMSLWNHLTPIDLRLPLNRAVQPKNGTSNLQIGNVNNNTGVQTHVQNQSVVSKNNNTSKEPLNKVVQHKKNSSNQQTGSLNNNSSNQTHVQNKSIVLNNVNTSNEQTRVSSHPILIQSIQNSARILQNQVPIIQKSTQVTPQYKPALNVPSSIASVNTIPVPKLTIIHPNQNGMQQNRVQVKSIIRVPKSSPQNVPTSNPPQNVPTSSPPQNVPTSNPPSYTTTMHLPPVTSSLGALPHQTQNNILQTSSSVTLQNSLPIGLVNNVLSDIGNNMSNKSLMESYGITYTPSSTVILPQSANISTPTQLVYQTNPSPNMLINEPNNYITYNPNNNIYNANTSVMMPSTVSQVFVSSTPVFTSASMLNSNPMTSVPVQPSNPLSTPSTSATVVPPLSPFSSSNVVNSTPKNFINSTILNLSSNNKSIRPNSFSANIDMSHQTQLMATYSNNNYHQSTSTLSGPVVTQSSTVPLPMIRVKNLLELK